MPIGRPGASDRRMREVGHGQRRGQGVRPEHHHAPGPLEDVDPPGRLPDHPPGHRLVTRIGESRLGLLAKIPLIAVQLNLKKLSFIYFARWVVIGRGSFPRLDPRQPEERLNYDYMIFCSNFTGTWDAYIDAFSEIIPAGIDGIWMWTVNYDRTRPITRFKKHIAANQADTDYYYSAYPGASTTDVRQALDLDAKLRAFADRALALPPDQFDAAYSHVPRRHPERPRHDRARRRPGVRVGRRAGRRRQARTGGRLSRCPTRPAALMA